MNTNSNPEEELVCLVGLEEGRLIVRCLFSSDRTFPLDEDQAASLEEGSILQGRICKGVFKSRKQLAAPKSVQANLYEIAAKQGLNPLFSQAVINEVEVILKNPGLNDPSLVNMDDQAFCTIDDAGTRDLDQALYIKRVDTHYYVYYALADAAYYVRPNTELYNESLKRGSSYYLPGLMIPMLPRPLCEGLISLNEKVIRRAMVFELRLDQAGICYKTRVFRARIKSKAKLSFEAVQEYLDYPDKKTIGDADLGKSLQLLKEVGELRLKLADERNIVRYRRHEVSVKLGKNGFRFNILDDLRNDVERYNEQLSLLCNIEGARLLKKNDNQDEHVHPVYRVHPRPPQSQVVSFERLLQALIKAHKLDPELWSWQQADEKSLSEYLKALPSLGKQARIAQAIHRQAVMINVRSSFSKQAAAHYGVGSDVYARFSAPMREIVGIFLHKELAEKHLGSSPVLSKSQDNDLRAQIIKIANSAKSVQRKITQQGNLLILNQLFSDDMKHTAKQRTSHEGTIIGLDNRKIYILLDKPKVEVKVYIKHLEINQNQTLVTESDKVTLSQQTSQTPFVRLGDSVFVSVKGQEKNRWVLVF